MQTKNTPEFANDLLKGADAIAEFLFGDRNGRRKVYYLAESSRLPLFRLGSQLCARRSVLIGWVAAQERRVRDREADEEHVTEVGGIGDGRSVRKVTGVCH